MKKTLLIAITLLTAAACQYKDLCYDHHHVVDVTLRYDWALAPAAAPASMTALYYPEAGEAIRYDYAGIKGGMARLSPGLWQAASYNGDTETILYRGVTSISTLEAHTRLSSVVEGSRLMSTRGEMPRAKGTESEAVILEPDWLWGGAGDVFAVQEDTPVTVTLSPRALVKEITIIIRDVPNLQYVSSLGGALSGLAGSVFVAQARAGEECVTQAFEAVKADATTITMHLLTFGHCPLQADGITNPHILTVYTVLADGSQWYYTEDITARMHDSAQDPAHIVIELSGMPVPKPIVNGSGFQPTVDGWQNVDIEVGM